MPRFFVDKPVVDFFEITGEDATMRWTIIAK